MKIRKFLFRLDSFEDVANFQYDPPSVLQVLYVVFLVQIIIYQMTNQLEQTIMQYFIKYLTSAPVVATLTLIIVATIFIELNYFFPGLQYGTYFHALP